MKQKLKRHRDGRHLQSVFLGCSPTDRRTWFSFQLSFSNGNRHRRILREKTIVDELISSIKRAIGSKGELGMFVLDFNSLSVYRPSSESMASSYEPIHAEVKLNADSTDVSEGQSGGHWTFKLNIWHNSIYYCDNWTLKYSANAIGSGTDLGIWPNFKCRKWQLFQRQTKLQDSFNGCTCQRYIP